MTPDGRLWPKPSLLRLAPGDAAIVLHALAHSATRVARAEPRLMVFFRVTPRARPERNRVVYPEALCDIWREWPGMADVVAAERQRKAPGPSLEQTRNTLNLLIKPSGRRLSSPAPDSRTLPLPGQRDGTSPSPTGLWRDGPP